MTFEGLFSFEGLLTFEGEGRGPGHRGGCRGVWCRIRRRLGGMLRPPQRRTALRGGSLVERLGFGVWGSGFGIRGLGVWGFGLRVWGLWLRMWGLGFGVEGLGFGVWD